jgi:hypothetical protein
MSLIQQIKKVFKTSKTTPYEHQEEINQLKSYLQKDADKAYVEGKKFLEKDPKHHFANYITAWGASKLGKHDEAILYVTQALTLKPRSYAYLQLRSSIYFKTREFEKALPDFRIMAELEPEIPSVWKNLLNVRRELHLDFPLPRNLVVVQDEIAIAYHDRKWDEYDSLVNELKTLDPLSAKYREILKEEFFMRLTEPENIWENFFTECQKQNAPLGFTALSAWTNWLIKNGKLEKALQNTSLFWNQYKKPTPTLHIVGICALLLGQKKYEVCLNFLDAMEKEMTSSDMRETLKLRTFITRMICQQQLGQIQIDSSQVFTNPFSDQLFAKMTQVHHQDSAPKGTLEQCISCWNKIKQTSDKIMLDLRFNSNQSEFLRQTILDHVKSNKPMSLMRMGDSDSYGFSETSPEIYPPELTNIMENIWWGRTIDIPLHDKVVHGFIKALEDADIIGFPSALRLTRDMEVENIKTIYTFHRKYQTLFAGVEKLLDQRRIQRNRLWVDEYCNFTLANQAFLENLISIAPSTVLITCYNIPKGHFLDHPKVSVINIPPHTQVASLVEKQSKILPELLEQKAQELEQKIQPGSLLLVSAGFAGKHLIQVGKNAGAIALDFGSAMDEMIGHKTRSSELHAQSQTWR